MPREYICIHNEIFKGETIQPWVRHEQVIWLSVRIWKTETQSKDESQAAESGDVVRPLPVWRRFFKSLVWFSADLFKLWRVLC